jgi:hypothetical protein
MTIIAFALCFSFPVGQKRRTIALADLLHLSCFEVQALLQFPVCDLIPPYESHTR